MKEVFTCLEGDICLTPRNNHESPYAAALGMFLYDSVDEKLGEMMANVKLSDFLGSTREFMI